MPPPPDTSIRSVSIIEEIVGSLGPWSRLALAERALRRALEVAAPPGHQLDPFTIAAIHSILDRSRAARLWDPIEGAQPPSAPAPALTVRAAQKPAESALVGAGLALLQAIDATPRSLANRTADHAAASAAQRCVERTLPLVIPRLLDAWAALRADARTLVHIDPQHTPVKPPLTDQTLGPLW